MGRAVGIDLGTTNSAIAIVDRHHRPVIVPNSRNAPTTPSVICFQDGRVVVGEDAKELQRAGHPDVAAFFKRHMGEPNFAFFAEGQDYSPAQLSGLLLKHLKDEAEATLGEPITDAVITVPAYFRDPHRKATIEAGRLAGLHVLQTINEPTAAAIAYGLKGTDRDRLVLVYDLGGGTFDITLLQIGPTEIRVRTSEGDHELGGKDWDDKIVDFLATRFKDEHGTDPFEDTESLAELLVRAEEAKVRLSQIERVPLSIMHAGRKGRYELTLATFEEITEPLMELTVSLTRKVLADQRLRPSQVDSILLVGGSTRMKMVQRFVQREFGKPPTPGVNVDEAVALGAAVVAHEHTRGGTRVQRVGGQTALVTLAGRIKTVDVTNHSLGMIAINADRSAYLNSIILPKNTEIPSTLSRPYQHVIRDQPRDLEVFITEGESTNPGSVTYLGRHVIRDVPPAEKGAQVVDIEYRYDVSGTVAVSAKVQATGQPLTVAVEPLPPDIPDRFLKPPRVEAATTLTTVYLAFDLSGSMSGEPLNAAQKAARTFLSQIDLSHCSMGLVTFADQVSVVLSACQDVRRIEDAVESLRIGDVGYGNETDPFRELLSFLKEVEGPRFAVVLADGVWYDQEAAKKRARACRDAGIEIIAIGFGGADREFLKAIASSDETGLFTSMSQLSETFGTIAQVITDRSVTVGTSGTIVSGERKSRLRIEKA